MPNIVEQDHSLAISGNTQEFIETLFDSYIETVAELERERLAVQRSWLGFAATIWLTVCFVLIVRAF